MIFFRGSQKKSFSKASFLQRGHLLSAATAVAPRGSAARQRRAVARPLRPKTAQISAHNGSSKVPVRYGTIRYDTVRYRPIPSDTVQRNVPFRTVPYRIGIGKKIRKFEIFRAQNRFSKNLHFKTIFWSPDSVFFILGFFEAFFDFISFFDAYQAS